MNGDMDDVHDLHGGMNDLHGVHGMQAMHDMHDMNPAMAVFTRTMWHQRFEPHPAGMPSMGMAGSGSVEPLRLLHDEADSDVEFLVGPEGDTWWIAGHREVLSASSPVFKAMLTGPLAHKGKVRIEDVDGRAFYELLR